MEQMKKEKINEATQKYTDKLWNATDWPTTPQRRAFNTIVNELAIFAHECIQEGKKQFLLGYKRPQSFVNENPWAPFFVLGWELENALQSCLYATTGGEKKSEVQKWSMKQARKLKRAGK